MRRSWTTILLSLGLLAVLAVLGVLQYRWMSQINASDAEKARKDVQDQASRFAEDVDKEVQGVYFNLQANAESFERKDWSAFNERYDFWRERTRYPEMVTAIYLAAATGEDMRYDRDARAFVPATLPPKIADLRAKIVSEKVFKPVYADPLVLAQPVHEVHEDSRVMIRRSAGAVPDGAIHRTPELNRSGYLIVSLDQSVLTEKLLPELAAKHFGDGEYKPAVVSAEGSPVFGSTGDGEADAKAGLLSMSPNNFVFFGNRELMSSLKVPKPAGEHDVMLNSRVETRSFSTVETGPKSDGKVEIRLQAESAPRTAVFTATTRGEEQKSPWVLQVRHSAGSIDAFMASQLRQNLAIGFGLLVLLAGAVAAIIWSAQRAKMLAQRQVDFVSSVSHEFRTPLAVIYSAGENLADGVAKDGTQVAKYGDLIKGEGRKLSAMVEQILDFAGANSGRRKFSFVSHGVGEIVAEALDECRPILEEKGFEVETQIDERLPHVLADRSAMTQAVQNLITNAVKYSNGSRWLRVSARNGDGPVRITVEDRGIGISGSDLKHVFEPFFRSRDVVDAQIHGNGLGLSLVKQIVTAHGGTVKAESEVGKGSKFTIELSEPRAL